MADMETNAEHGGAEAVKQAVSLLGGTTFVARQLGVKAPNVHQWMTGTRKIPPLRALQLERMTGRRVTRHQMRPDKDAYWRVLEETV